MAKRYTRISVTALLLIQFILLRVNAQNCWSPLGSGIGTPANPGGVFTSTVYNGNLIVAGAFDTVGGIPAANIAMWNGTSWSALGSGIKFRTHVWNYTGGIVHSLAVYNGELYATGTFDTAGGIQANSIAKWDGNSWSAVGGGIPGFALLGPNDTTGTVVNAMAVYNGELYVGGSYTLAGGVSVSDIAKWNGSSWSAVGAGIGNTQLPTQSTVTSLTVINNKLYAGGGFQNASGVSAINIAAWDGNAWTALGAGVGNDTAGLGSVTSIVSYQGDIYAAVAGNDPNVNPDFSIEKWDGTSWSSVVGGPGTGVYYDGYIFALLPFNGNLVADGYFTVIGNDSSAASLAQYNGTGWSTLATGTDTSEYFSLINYNDHLYVEGVYVTIGGISASGIAEYTCATSAGVGEVNPKLGVHLYPNPTNGFLNISVNNLQDKATVTICNLLGQTIWQSTMASGKTELNLTGQPAGTYIYRISGQNGEPIGAGTFVVQ